MQRSHKMLNLCSHHSQLLVLLDDTVDHAMSADKIRKCHTEKGAFLPDHGSVRAEVVQNTMNHCAHLGSPLILVDPSCPFLLFHCLACCRCAGHAGYPTMHPLGKMGGWASSCLDCCDVRHQHLHLHLRV